MLFFIYVETFEKYPFAVRKTIVKKQWFQSSESWACQYQNSLLQILGKWGTKLNINAKEC